jgi:hypothetical protein
MTNHLADGISTRELVDPEDDRMPEPSKNSRIWESFRWGSIVAAIVTGFYVGSLSHGLVREVFSVDTQGWRPLGVAVWVTCTAVAVNVAWLGVRVAGFFVDEAFSRATREGDRSTSLADPDDPNDR